MMSDYRNRIKDYRTVDAAQIRRNPANFRRHPDAQRAALRSILGDVGQVAPLLVLEDGDGYLLLDGEARWSEGGTWPVAVLDLSPDEAATVLAMLDKIGADAEIDPAALMALLDSLPEDARQTTGAAWSDDELAALIGEPDIVPGAGGDEFDPTPATDGPTRTALGDLWIIGGVHRMLVGDCTDAANVERLMGGERAAALWCDPPFGIEYTGHGASVDGRANKFAPIAGDDKPRGAWLSLWLPQDSGAIYLKTTWAVLREWEDFIKPLARLKSRIVWDKCSHVAGDVNGGYATQSEIVLFAVIGNHKTNRFDTDVWSIPRATTGAPELRSGHPYESPIALPQRAIENSTQVGDIVADPSTGSGTAMIAAHRTGRRCYGMEISPRYADLILARAEAEGLTVDHAHA